MLAIHAFANRPDPYQALLKAHGHLLEPRRSPAIEHMLKTCRPPVEPAGLMLKVEASRHPEWDESKHPRKPDGTFAHAAFFPDKHGADGFRHAVSMWFGIPPQFRNGGQPLVIGEPPAVLRMLGCGPDPLQIDRGTLIKVSRPHGNDPKGHGITKEQLAQLPERIADPIAVYSVKGETGLEVLTQMVDSRGEQVMVAIQIGKLVGKGKIVNDVASIYGRPDKDYLRWLESGVMLYADEEKENPAFQSGLLPYLRRRVPVRRGDVRILTPNDVVKFHRAHGSGVASKSEGDARFDLLKAHISLYTRRDGTVVQAHEDSRTATQADPAAGRYSSSDVLKSPDGSPLVVYHGTGVLGHDGSFKTASYSDAIYFAMDPKLAATYANGSADSLPSDQSAQQIFARHVSAKNPMYLDSMNLLEDDHKKIVSDAKAKGHDAIVIKNAQNLDYDDVGGVVMVFSGDQVMSVKSDTGGTVIPHPFKSRAFQHLGDGHYVHGPDVNKVEKVLKKRTPKAAGASKNDLPTFDEVFGLNRE